MIIDNFYDEIAQKLAHEWHIKVTKTYLGSLRAYKPVARTRVSSRSSICEFRCFVASFLPAAVVDKVKNCEYSKIDFLEIDNFYDEIAQKLAHE